MTSTDRGSFAQAPVIDLQVDYFNDGELERAALDDIRFETPGGRRLSA